LPAPSVNGRGDTLKSAILGTSEALTLNWVIRHTVMHHSSTYQISLKANKRFGRTDGCTYWRTDISPSNVIRSTPASRPTK